MRRLELPDPKVTKRASNMAVDLFGAARARNRFMHVSVPQVGEIIGDIIQEKQANVPLGMVVERLKGELNQAWMNEKIKQHKKKGRGVDLSEPIFPHEEATNEEGETVFSAPLETNLEGEKVKVEPVFTSPAWAAAHTWAILNRMVPGIKLSKKEISERFGLRSVNPMNENYKKLLGMHRIPK
jgi:hypothetical protein